MCRRIIGLSIAQTRAFCYLRFTAQDARACSESAWQWLCYELENYAYAKAL